MPEVPTLHNTPIQAKRQARAARCALPVMAVWTVAVWLMVTWHLAESRRFVTDSARIQARSIFQKDVIFRRWAAGHGGVYVPVTPQTPPNPYLSDNPERDIETPSGRKLTLINPAYMTRQVHELAFQAHAHGGHITSLHPLRPENKPDEWETKALQDLHAGDTEISSVETIRGQPQLRLMRPLITEASCLQCHAAQGYKEGDIRGGIGVTVPLAPLVAANRRHVTGISLAYAALWLLGMGVVVIICVRVKDRQEEQAQATEALRKSQALLTATGRIARVGGWELDAQTLEVHWTEETYRLHGISPEHKPSLEGVLEFYHHEDQSTLKQAIQQALDNGVPYNLELRFVTAQGKHRWVHTACTPHVVAGKTVSLSGTFQDITDHRAMQAKLQQSQRLKSVGTLASGVAHEINNPINGIMNYAQLILDDARETNETTAGFAAEIIRESERIATITQALLSISEQTAQSRREQSVQHLIKTVLALVQSTIRLDQITMEIDIPTGLPLVDCSKHQIQQVLLNLINNARDSLNERFPGFDAAKVLRLTTQCLDENGKQWVRTTVEDNGTGIDKDVFDHIFDPFFTTRDRTGGKATGLGLSMNHTVVEVHGGRLTAESKPGEFTRFHLDLPAVCDGPGTTG